MRRLSLTKFHEYCASVFRRASDAASSFDVGALDASALRRATSSVPGVGIGVVVGGAVVGSLSGDDVAGVTGGDDASAARVAGSALTATTRQHARARDTHTHTHTGCNEKLVRMTDCGGLVA